MFTASSCESVTSYAKYRLVSSQRVETLTVLLLLAGFVKVTELADGQTLSFKLPSMVMGESVLRDVMEPEVVEGVGVGVGAGVGIGVGVGVGGGVGVGETVPL